MAKQLKVRYTLQTGALPNGMMLDPDTGVISGAPGWDALGLGPSWTGPAAGSLGSFNENDSFPTITFQATTAKTPMYFGITSGYLPWGLSFNPQTGVLSGTIAPLKQRVNETASNYDGPKWNTAFGTLANYDEGSSASLNLSATPIGQRTMRGYQVVDGYLPWGLKLNMQTGVISGTTANLKNPGAYVDVPKLPVPTWNTTAGNLLTVNEYGTVSLTFSATPASGRSMAKYVVNKGFLPFGLRLNTQTGAITGKPAEVIQPGDSAFYDSSQDPTLSASVWSYRATPQAYLNLPNGGSLGTFNKGDTFGFRFTAAPNGSKTLRNVYVSSGNLPFGIRCFVKPSGNATLLDIDGTILNNVRTKSGTYTFTVAVTDNPDSSFCINTIYRTFSITVQ